MAIIMFALSFTVYEIFAVDNETTGFPMHARESVVMTSAKALE